MNPMPFVVKIGRQTTIVESLRSASDEWCRFRDAHALGASESPSVWVFSNGKKVARVSYNGRIWDLHGNEILLQAEMVMPKYQPGDYVKVEFSDEATGIGEWMWVRVDRCDDEGRLVFGVLDNEPVNDYAGKIKLGSQLAVSFDNIRDHRTQSKS